MDDSPVFERGQKDDAPDFGTPWDGDNLMRTVSSTVTLSGNALPFDNSVLSPTAAEADPIPRIEANGDVDIPPSSPEDVVLLPPPSSDPASIADDASLDLTLAYPDAEMTPANAIELEDSRQSSEAPQETTTHSTIDEPMETDGSSTIAPISPAPASQSTTADLRPPPISSSSFILGQFQQLDIRRDSEFSRPDDRGDIVVGSESNTAPLSSLPPPEVPADPSPPMARFTPEPLISQNMDHTDDDPPVARAADYLQAAKVVALVGTQGLSLSTTTQQEKQPLSSSFHPESSSVNRSHTEKQLISSLGHPATSTTYRSSPVPFTPQPSSSTSPLQSTQASPSESRMQSTTPIPTTKRTLYSGASGFFKGAILDRPSAPTTPGRGHWRAVAAADFLKQSLSRSAALPSAARAVADAMSPRTERADCAVKIAGPTEAVVESSSTPSKDPAHDVMQTPAPDRQAEGHMDTSTSVEGFIRPTPMVTVGITGPSTETRASESPILFPNESPGGPIDVAMHDNNIDPGRVGLKDANTDESSSAADHFDSPRVTLVSDGAVIPPMDVAAPKAKLPASLPSPPLSQASDIDVRASAFSSALVSFSCRWMFQYVDLLLDSLRLAGALRPPGVDLQTLFLRDLYREGGRSWTSSMQPVDLMPNSINLFRRNIHLNPRAQRVPRK